MFSFFTIYQFQTGLTVLGIIKWIKSRTSPLLIEIFVRRCPSGLDLLFFLSKKVGKKDLACEGDFAKRIGIDPLRVLNFSPRIRVSKIKPLSCGPGYDSNTFLTRSPSWAIPCVLYFISIKKKMGLLK